MKSKPTYNFIFFFTLFTLHMQGQNTWEPVGPANITIHSFRVKGSTLYAGGNCHEGGVFLTADYGEHWDQVNAGLPGDQTPIRSIAISDTSILSAAVYRGVYKTTNPPQDWGLFTTSLNVYSISFAGDPWNAIVIGGTGVKGVSKVSISYDGIHWSSISNGLPVEGVPIYSILVRDTSLFVSTGHGVYRYSINASHWEPSNFGMSNTRVYSLSQNASQFFAGSEDKGVYTSQDGYTWNQKNTGLEIEDTEFTSFAFYGSDIFVAASGKHGGVFQSDNNGESWYAINAGLPAGVNINALAIIEPFLYAGTDSNGVYRSDLDALTGTHQLGQENFNGSQLVVYPNPVSDELTISLTLDGTVDDSLNNIEFNCYSPLGQVILHKELKIEKGQLQTNIDISNLPEGMYLLQFRNQKQSVFRKIVINK